MFNAFVVLFETPFVVLSLLILLPFIPAFLLFKLLPNSADVDGPLAGLTLKLKGSFGGYIALTVFMTGVAVNAKILKPALVWHVQGNLQIENQAPGDTIKCTLQPLETELPVASDQTFTFDVPMGDGTTVPHLSFTTNKGYISGPVNFTAPGQPGNLRMHMQDPTTVVFDDAIVLRPRGKFISTTTVAGGL
jgi:hypothetical protein